ncbi:hypothetical protein BHM03_00039247 [Ensete ventricosum]|nr:hypothetical protein BHM03_00039247 [Ensete ventricosum]
MAGGLTAPVAFASFPVVFFDGDREIDIGSILVTPSLGFGKFQAVISQRIGVAPHQISMSLVRHRNARASSDVRRKVPIDETSDLGAIARERDCFVLAVLRRPRRERRGRSRRKNRAGDDGMEGKKEVPEMTILRRNPAGSGGLDPPLGGLVPEAMAGMGLWDHGTQLRDLQLQREKWLLSTAMAAALYEPFVVAEDGYAWESRTRAEVAPPRPAACEACEAARAEGRVPSFHWCVRDAVTFRFRSPVGPIQRPSRKRVEASA